MSQGYLNGYLSPSIIQIIFTLTYRNCKYSYAKFRSSEESPVNKTSL